MRNYVKTWIKQTWESCCADGSGRFRLREGWRERNSLFDRYMLTSGQKQTGVNTCRRRPKHSSYRSTHFERPGPEPCSSGTPSPWFLWPGPWTSPDLLWPDAWPSWGRSEPTGGPGTEPGRRPLEGTEVERQRKDESRRAEKKKVNQVWSNDRFNSPLFITHHI